MALYTYSCPNGHSQDVRARMGALPIEVQCAACVTHARRDFAADMLTIQHKVDDPIRARWLSSDLPHEMERQQRHLDPIAPKDKFEAARVHEKTGRVYFGNDDSKLSSSAQRAIAKGRRGEHAYQDGKPSLT